MRSIVAVLTVFSFVTITGCSEGERDVPGSRAPDRAGTSLAASVPSATPQSASSPAAPSPSATPQSASSPAAPSPTAPTATSSAVPSHVATSSAVQHAVRTPNELGRIPILEYHLIGEPAGQWRVPPDAFRSQLELLYDRGYRPVNLRDVLDRKLNLPRGMSPVVIVFDDASPSQFRYIEEPDGTLTIDPTSAVGIWLDFARSHPGWENRAVFCMLPAAEAGRSFFGDKGIEGQKSAWRFQKVRFLREQGFELCNHTLWHANLGKYDDAFVQEQIARGELAIDSVLPDYDVRTFALPLGVWPKNRELAYRGAWTDPKSGRTFRYEYDSVLRVAGGPARSPYDPEFDGRSLPRFIVYDAELEKLLDRLDRDRSRYVSDGDPGKVTRPEVP